MVVVAESENQISRAECAGLIEARLGPRSIWSMKRFPALNARASLKRYVFANLTHPGYDFPR